MMPHSYFSYEYVYLSPGYSWQPINPFHACQSSDVSTVHHWKCDIGVCFGVNWGKRIITSYFPKQTNSIVMSQYRVLWHETADTSSVSEFSVATMMNRITSQAIQFWVALQTSGEEDVSYTGTINQNKSLSTLFYGLLLWLTRINFNRHLVKEIK